MGRVVGTAMSKTAKVAVTRQIKHPKYGKYMNKTKLYLCHDENELCVVGDEVTIVSCRPVSKRKTFSVDRIIHPTERKLDNTGKLHTQWS
eukprot:CFRG4706T1